MTRFMPERLEYHHEPPLPHDGSVERDHLRAAQRAELEVFRSAMADFRMEQRPLRRDGDAIIIEYRLRGTTPSGRTVDFPGKMVAKVEGGLIRRLTAVMEGDPSLLREVLAARGIGHPDGAPSTAASS